MRATIDDTVKMREDFKDQTYNHDIIEHIQEFGECTGKVIGYTYDDTEDYVDVRWQPSGLRYGYHYNDLVVIGK